MRNQTKVLTIMAVIAILAVVTGSVLLFGYAVAALSLSAVVYVGGRKLVNYFRNRRAGRPTASRPIGSIRPDRVDTPRAA
jgi:hypothetical protein